MGRPKLPPGAWGNVNISHVGKSKYKARARFRNANGHTVSVARFGQTKGAARDALLTALADMRATVRSTTVTRGTSFAAVAALWLEQGGSPRPWAPRTRESYGYNVRNVLTPALGGLDMGELDAPSVDAALRHIVAKHGPGAARTAKTALSGITKLAIRHGALTVNPVRDASTIPGQRSTVRALTPEQTEQLTDLLRSDDRAVRWDLPDLADWMLGTGARIGEACALRRTALTIAGREGTWEINTTLVRAVGHGGLMVQERPKTAAGWRVLALPAYLIDLLERRASELHFTKDGVIFASASANALRDPSNTAGDLREVLDRIGCPVCGGRGWHPALKTERQRANPPRPRDGWDEPCDGSPPFAWVHSHVFRKTVATRLREAGLTAEQIADHLGHAKPSMTQDVYIGRQVTVAAAASILDR